MDIGSVDYDDYKKVCSKSGNQFGFNLETTKTLGYFLRLWYDKFFNLGYKLRSLNYNILIKLIRL
jgi:hypothetical protein